jgi:hypothetical protein
MSWLLIHFADAPELMIASAAAVRSMLPLAAVATL